MRAMTMLEEFRRKDYDVKTDETFGCNAEIWKNNHFVISIKKFCDGIIIFNGKNAWQLNQMEHIIPSEKGITISGTYGVVNTPTSMFFGA